MLYCCCFYDSCPSECRFHRIQAPNQIMRLELPQSQCIRMTFTLIVKQDDSGACFIWLKKHAKKAHKKHTIKKALRCLFYLVKKSTHSGPVLVPFWPGPGPILARSWPHSGGPGPGPGPGWWAPRIRGSQDPGILGFWHTRYRKES